MRVLVMIKANADSENGVYPDEKFLAEMDEYNKQLMDAGVMLAGEGLHPSSKGKRVKFSGGKAVGVTDGPFTETKELLAGYWIWQVKSMEEAVEWIKRCPSPADAPDEEVEIRPIFDEADFREQIEKQS